MKHILIAVILLSCLHRTFAQVDYGLTGESLKGKVKMVTEIQSYEGYKGPYMKTIDKYDLKGCLTEEIHNDYFLKLNIHKTFHYDTAANGSITKFGEFDDSGHVLRAIDYKYDSLSRLIEVNDLRNFDDKKSVYRNQYYYDSAGRKVMERNYTDTTLNYKTFFFYNSQGRITASKSYDQVNKLIMENDYNYLADPQWLHSEKTVEGIRTHIFRIIDSAGILLEKTTYTADYSKYTTESYTNFDSHGNWLKESVKGEMIENYFVTRVIEYYK